MSLTYNMKLYDQGCMVAVKNMLYFFYCLETIHLGPKMMLLI